MIPLAKTTDPGTQTTTLANKNLLVIGGAGEVGEGIVRQMLNHGGRVIVLSRSGERLAFLRERLQAGEMLVTIEGNATDPNRAEELRDRIIDRAGFPDAVVASIGVWKGSGYSIFDTTPQDWDLLLRDNLTAHFIAAKTFLPLIAKHEENSYTLINGRSALIPVPGAGGMSIVASALLMLKEVLVSEFEASPVRINTLLLGTPVVTRSRRQFSSDWITADDVGSYAVFLASKAGGQIRGQTIVLESSKQVSDLNIGR